MRRGEKVDLIRIYVFRILKFEVDVSPAKFEEEVSPAETCTHVGKRN